MPKQERRSGGEVFESELPLRFVERDKEKQLACRNVSVLKIRVSVVAHFPSWTLLLDFAEYQTPKAQKPNKPTRTASKTEKHLFLCALDRSMKIRRARQRQPPGPRSRVCKFQLIA
ncbi:hypothetical protein PQQ99_01085 [Paraburkholderia sediminicola]|uniref:hypothetical protein n=1 Tax=Paraburkholderia sediminicola TaxID=458836 RepID=UPI0038BBBDED